MPYRLVCEDLQLSLEQAIRVQSAVRFGGSLLLLVLLWASSSSPPEARSASSDETRAAIPHSTSDPIFDSARAEVEAGRYWHASRLLRSTGDAAEGRSPSETLLLARADAGWRNWSGVVRALEGAGWLDDLEEGEGRRLLARGLEAAERWAVAADNFRLYRRNAEGEERLGPETSREARAAARAGRRQAALEAIRVGEAASAELAGWTALEIAEWISGHGEVARVAELLPWIQLDSAAFDAAWEVEGRTFLAAGDTTRALDVFRRILETQTSSERRGWAFSTIGAVSLAQNDSADAQEAFQASLAVHPRGESGARAAKALIEMGNMDRDLALLAGQTLDRVGDSRGSLRAYRTYDGLLPDSERLDPGVALTISRLLSAVGRYEEAVREYRILVETDDADFELKVLDQWLRTRRRQGRSDAVLTIQGWIINRFPESLQAVDIVFRRAASAQDRGAYAEALSGFEWAATMAPARAPAGRARMRLGQIHLQQGAVAAAAETFKEYLDEFPNGRRWDQAAYWAGRSLEALGRDEEAAGYLDMILRRSPASYYGVLAAEHLGRPYRLPVPVGPSPDPPEWLRAGLATLDLLIEAGLDRGAESLVAQLITRVNGSVPVSLDLAENLIERGFTLEGIGLGWELLSDGAPQSQRLLRVLYPFPYREMVMREAQEAGVDPLFLASLIRQESAFAPTIRSRAGAIGLMQVMPETGREVATRQGIGGFAPESLERADINLHLGTTYWTQVERRYGPDHLPLALSAYNAGPTRARRWSRFPEAQDPLRFTERIPFDETRGYVKNITRNLHLYRSLYPED